MSKTIGGFQKDLSSILFVSGIAALFIVPFLTWYNYGFNLDFPSQVSLIWLFQNGSPLGPSLYFIGIAVTIIVLAAFRRPVIFQGIPPIIFPALVAIQVITASIENHFPGYLQILTDGMFTAFFGFALLEASYFSYRRRKKSAKPELVGKQMGSE